MTESTGRLSSALADRYQILSRLGEGGMAPKRGQQRAAEGSGGGSLREHLEFRFTAHRTPHTAL